MNILGIRFRAHGQTYFFSSTQTIELNSMVVVDTEQGIGIGEVITIHDALPASIEQEEVRSVVRLAHTEDLRIAGENTALAAQALTFCQECIRTRKLDMKLVDVEVYYDRSKIIFYFTAPARIDFRELVKDLVREYRSRIELRQIGVRHETQMVGAVGNCGMVCCCRRFLRKFAPVTIRMAKEQNLFLNPAKISGICGRLLCCLSYEQDNYDAFHHNCPRLGKKYQTTQGSMKVLRANMFRNTLSVLNENNEELEFSLDDWKEMAPHRPENTAPAGPPQARTEKPPHAHDGLLVLSVTPETVDDPDLFDDVLPPLPPLEGAADEETGAQQDSSSGGKGRRKRKRKSRTEENGV